MNFKTTHNCVIELDGILYRFANNTLVQIPDIADVKSDIVYMSDMQDSVSKIVTVEAPLKYAPVIVRKEVQESGEFDSQVTIVTHWKRKINLNLTEIFYTAVPSTIYNSYFESINSHKYNILFFPLYNALLTVLKSIRSNTPVCVVFQHSRFADILIGTKNKIFYTNRCVAFDNSAEQINALWDTVVNDVADAEIQNKIEVKKIVSINWLENEAAVEWPKNKEVVFLKSKEVAFNDEDKQIGFLSIPEKLSLTSSISPGIEKLSYLAKAKNNIFNCFLFCLILISFSFSFFWYFETKQIKKRINTAEAKIQNINIETPTGFSYEKFKTVFSFIKQLDHCRNSLSFKDIVNEISDRFASDTILESLTIQYPDEHVELTMIGRIESPFEVAHKRYQDLVSTLKSHGYSITEKAFNTQIKNSQFSIKATRKI